MNDSVSCDLWKISDNANNLGLDNLNIFHIILDEDLDFTVTKIDVPCKIIHIQVGVKYFIEKFLKDSENRNFWELNKNSLFILKDGNYSDLNILFESIQGIKTKVVRGSSQKSHLVSPIDFRLSCYMLILFDLNYKAFNRNNSFNIVTKDRYLPSSE